MRHRQEGLAMAKKKVTSSDVAKRAGVSQATVSMVLNKKYNVSFSKEVILQGKLDVESLISQLNAALAEEWLAYYQYWVGALVVEGAMRADVQSEFEEHAEEERKHAQLLANRIIELEGVPVLDPKKWFELARCKYDAPQEFDSISLLKDNVASERCAILRYQEIADFTNGKDFTTCDIAKHILAEEEEHEQDLQDYLTDITRMKKSFLDK